MKISKFAIMPLLLLALSGCSSSDKTTATTASASPTPAAVLPYIKGTGVSMLNQTLTSPSGEVISLIPASRYHLTVLSLWCPSSFNGSNAQLQELIKLHQAYKDRGVRIIVVAYDTPSKEITEAIKNMNITFEMGTGNQQLYDALTVSSLPTTWYIDSAGAIIKTVEGFEALEEMTASINEIVEKYGSTTEDNSAIEGTAPTSNTTNQSSEANNPTSEVTLPATSPSATPGHTAVDAYGNIVETAAPEATATPVTSNIATSATTSPTASTASSTADTTVITDSAISATSVPEVAVPAPATSTTTAEITLTGKVTNKGIQASVPSSAQTTRTTRTTSD